MRISNAFKIIVFLVLAPSCAHSESPIDIELAKKQGIILYNQYKPTSAIPLLTIAAEDGDNEAQYFLAEALRKKGHYINADSLYWYETAAAQGNLLAMIQLGRKNDEVCSKLKSCGIEIKPTLEWLTLAQKIIKPKAESGDAESMYLMYELTTDKTWLTKAAKAGHSVAQYWMGISERQGDGFFLPWQRGQSVEKWFKASAEGGYPKGMKEYSLILAEKDDFAGYREWNERAALTGFAPAVFDYGSDLAHLPDLYGYKLDAIKGYALIYLLKELDGGGGMQADVKDQLSKITKKITPDDVVKAVKLSEKWKSEHPPLSFFPDKLSR